MGTYIKSSINRTARPRSERLRELGGLIVPVGAAAAAGYAPTGSDHTHANLADLNRITITDGYIYLTDEVIEEGSDEVVVTTTKAMAGYADRAGANADGYTLDWFIPVTVNGTLTLKLNPVYASLWAEGQIAAGGVGSGGSGGGSTVSVAQILTSGTSIATITVDGVATTLYAPAGGGTAVSWGTVDGYSIPLTVGSTTKNLLLATALPEVVTLTGTQTISGSKTFSAATSFSGNVSVGGTVTVAGKDMIDLTQSGMTMFGFGSRAERSFNGYGTAVNLRACDANGDQVNILSVQSGVVVVGSKLIPNYVTGLDLGGNSSNQRWSTIYGVDGNLSGGLTFRDSANTVATGFLSFPAGYMILRAGANIGSSYKQLTFHETNGFYPEQSGVNLGANGASYRWANIYGVNGNLSGDLTLASTSHIDLGPVRIEYDSTNKAIHIKKADSNDTNEYGLYCDGFLSGGGVQASS